MTSIAEQFHEIASRLIAEGKPPVRVIFSHDGYYKALQESQGSDNNPFETYMGLPFTVRSDMRGDIGLDYKFEKRPDAVTVQLSFDAKSGYMFADGHRLVGEPVQVMQIVGSKLTAPQLCDLIQGFLDADDSTHFGEFEKDLERIVREHGRFE